MTIKQTIKAIIPTPLWRKLRLSKQNLQIKSVSLKQAQRFAQWISYDCSTDKARVETRLAFDIHRLEKGLSHAHFRYGFGMGVLQSIAMHMMLLEHADPDYSTNPLYKQGIAVLHEYRIRHDEQGYDLSNVKALFSKKIWEKSGNSIDHIAGSFNLDTHGKRNNLEKGFRELAENRYSVREYSSEPVSQELLDQVYQVSMKTPSVCNRQATRIYQISDPAIIESALDIQGGFHGYKAPPVLLFITSDIRAFMNANERNEPFVDGGLFAMSLLYALEAYGLAACPLNAMFDQSQDNRTRQLLNIPDNELPIMYIAVGNFPSNIPVCRSTRRTVESILTKI